MEISFSRFYCDKEYKISIKRKGSLCAFDFSSNDYDDSIYLNCKEIQEALVYFNSSFSSANERKPFYDLFDINDKGFQSLLKIVGLLSPHMDLFIDYFDETFIDNEIWTRLTEYIPGKIFLDFEEVFKGTDGNQVILITDKDFNKDRMNDAYNKGSVGRLSGTGYKNRSFICYWIESNDADRNLDDFSDIKSISISKINNQLREKFQK